MARQGAPDRDLAKGFKMFSTFHRKRTKNEAAELREFITLLGAREVRENASEILPSALREADRFGIDRAHLADGCNKDPASISRWSQGKVRTDPEIARKVMSVLRQHAIERLSELTRKIAAR